MRTTRRLVCGALVAVLATLVGAVPPAQAAVGPVPNPSFDDGWLDKKPVCWSLSGGDTGRLTLTSKSHSGFGAYAEGRGRAGTKLELVTDPTPACQTKVSALSINRLQFWMRSTAGARPILYAWSAKRGWTKWLTGRKIPPGPLRRYSVKLPPTPLGVTAVRVGVVFDAASTVVLDDVAVLPPSGQLMFGPRFPARNGLVTNEFAYWSPSDPRHIASAIWELTSGSLFSKNGNGYTGVPDDRSTDAQSRSGNDSAIFRLTTRDQTFGDVMVQTRINVRRLSSTRSTPRVDWDGVHLFLRYKSQYQLYYASVARRDGKVVIKKKCPGGHSNNGTYYPLTAEVVGNPISFGAWMAAGASVRDNDDGTVTLTLFRNGRPVIKATDRGVGCKPLTGSGAVGFRGDNAEFEFTDYRVTALG